MPISELEPTKWTSELDSFSRQHEGWIVTIASQAPGGGAISVEAVNVPLQGVSRSAPHSQRVVIDVGEGDEHLLHEVDVRRLTMESSPDRAIRSLTLEGKDGTTTTVTFQSPTRAEDADALPRR